MMAGLKKDFIQINGELFNEFKNGKQYFKMAEELFK